MKTKEALESHNKMQKTNAFKSIENMIEDAGTYGTQRRTIKMSILQNGFIDENEQEREDFIRTRIVKINVEIDIEEI